MPSFPASLSPEPTAVPGAAASLLGRERELAAVRRHLDRPGTDCAVVVVEGDAGIGKTAFASRFARDAVRARWTVLSGRAPDDGGTPFGAFVDLLGPTDLLDALPDPATWFPQASARARQHLYREVRAGLSALPSGRGLAVVLDDVQYADDESVGLLAALLRHPPTGPAVLMLCSRTDRLPADLDRALAGRVIDRLHLGPLDGEALAALCGPATSRRRQVLVSASRGNPRYLRVLADLPTSVAGDLDAQPGSVAAAPGRASADAEIIAELRALPEMERLVAGTAALLGNDVDVELVTAVAGLPAEPVVAAVDALAARDLLAVRADRLVFSHPLVRCAAYRLSRPAWRVVAHRRALDELRRRGARRHDLAPHVAACAQIGDRPAAMLLADAARALLPRDPAAAARWVEVARHVLPGDDTSCLDELSVLLARAYALTGRSAAAAQLLRGLSGARRAEPDVGLLLAQCERACGHIEEAAALLRSMVARTAAGPAAIAAVRLELAGLDILRGHAPHDLTAFVTSADPPLPPALRAAAGCIAAIASVNGSETGAVGAAGRLVDALHEDELTQVIGHLHLLAWSEFHLDRLDVAARHVERARAAAARTGLHEAAPCLQIVRSAVASRRGALDVAAQAAGEAEEIAAELGFGDYRIMAAAARVLPTLWVDGPLAVQALLVRLPDLATIVSPWARGIAATWTAEALLMVGRADAAAGAATVALQAGRALGDPQEPRMLALSAIAAMMRGDLVDATALATDAARLADRSGRPAQLGAAAGALAKIALTSHDLDAAALHAQRAVRHFEPAGLRLAAAQARLLVGEIARTSGDQDLAQAELGAAKRVFESCGASWLGVLATNAQRRMGSSVPRYAGGADGLSRRENEIATMLSEGLTNKAIADRLVLSVRTVDSHVARILRKLGVTSRAAVARRLGGIPT